MSQYNLNIGSANATVRVISDESQWIDRLNSSAFLKRYIPAVEINAEENGSPSIFELKLGQPDFNLLSPIHAIYSNYKFQEKDIVSVIEYLLEYLRNLSGIYCLHASGVVLDSKGIIFWGGASGMGKTRMAINLTRNYGAKFYSDEKIILDLSKKVMVGGIPSAYLSKPFFEKEYGANEFTIFDSINEHVPIGLMVHSYVEETSKDYFVEKWVPEKFNWHLYEELSRKIRGTSRRLFNNTVPILSIDNNSTAGKRCLDVNKFTDKTACYYMRGSGKKLCKEIVKLLAS